MNGFHPGWYLIYTKPRHEKKMHTHLAGMSINSFLPTRKTLRTWHDRKKYVDEPLFPSYIFVFPNSRQDYYECMDAEGFLYFVKSGKEVAKVNDSIVNNIKLLVDHNNDLEVSDTRFQPGKRLVICQGALTGLSCELVQVNSQQKLLVRVDLLQRNILLTLPVEFLMTA